MMEAKMVEGIGEVLGGTRWGWQGGCWGSGDGTGFTKLEGLMGALGCIGGEIGRDASQNAEEGNGSVPGGWCHLWHLPRC